MKAASSINHKNVYSSSSRGMEGIEDYRSGIATLLVRYNIYIYPTGQTL